MPCWPQSIFGFVAGFICACPDVALFLFSDLVAATDSVSRDLDHESVSCSAASEVCVLCVSEPESFDSI